MGKRHEKRENSGRTILGRTIFGRGFDRTIIRQQNSVIGG
jgi:hypothetical protein